MRRSSSTLSRLRQLTSRPLRALLRRGKVGPLDRLYREANAAYHGGRYADAAALFAELVEADPLYPKAAAKLAGLRGLGASGVPPGDQDEEAIVSRGDATEMDGSFEEPDLWAVYAAANSAYHSGKYEEAVEAFREVVARDPGFPKARAKLAGLLRQHGVELEHAGDLMGATAAYREASQLDPRSQKAAVRLASVLTTRAADALTAVDDREARRLLTAAVQARPTNDRSVRLLEKLDRLPRGRFTDYAGLPASGRLDLVFVEQGVDPTLLGAYLRHFDGAAFFSEGRLPIARLGDRVPRAIHDEGTAGLEEDAQLCALTDGLAAEIRSVVSSVLPGSFRLAGPLDVLDLLSFQLDDVAFSAGRKSRLFKALLESGRYGRVVLLLGTGDFGECAYAHAAERFGADRVYHMWCSPSMELYDERATRGRVRRPQKRRAFVGSRRHLPRSGVTARSRAGGDRRSRGIRPVLVLANPATVHVENIGPVVRALQSLHEVLAIVPPGRRRDAPAYARLEQLARGAQDRFRFLDLPPASPFWRSPVAQWRLRRMVRRIDRAAGDLDLQLDGGPFWPAVRRGVAGVVTEGIPRLREFMDSFEALIAAHEPSVLVVAPDRTPFARAACALARASGIPSLFPQAVLMAKSPRLKPLQADYVTVLDHFTADLFVKHFGADPGQVRVTGIPRLSQPTGSAEQDREREAGSPRGASTREVALMLQRFSPRQTEDLIRVVATAMMRVEDARLTVKMHPGDAPANRGRYGEVLRDIDFPHEFEIVQRRDAREVIAASSLVVSVFSNVVLEAAVAGRLVLCVNLTGSSLPIPFVEQGVAVGAASVDDVGSILPRCLDDAVFIEEARRRQQEYFRKNTHLSDGGAAERVAAFLRELASDRGPQPNGGR